MIRPSELSPVDPARAPSARPWLRLALVMILPLLWLVAGLAFLPPVR